MSLSFESGSHRACQCAAPLPRQAFSYAGSLASAFVVLMLLGLAALSSTRVHASEQTGTVVALGGAMRADNEEVWSRLVALAGGKKGHWLIVPAASGDPEKSANEIISRLKKRGASAEMIPLSKQLKGVDASALVKDPGWLKKLSTARGVFFTGGRQQRIADLLLESDGRRTPMLDAIWALLKRGGVVAGSSAGTAIMSETMFSEPRDVLSLMIDGAKREAGADISTGLGFVGPGLLVDQHFVKRGRIGRALAVMAQEGIGIGVGVEEDSGVIFRGAEIEVIGGRGAIVADLRGAIAQSKPLRVKNARLHWLESGDRMNLQTGEVTVSKSKLAGNKLDHSAKGFKPYYNDVRFTADILGDDMVLASMTQLVDSPKSEARGIVFKPGVENRTGFEFRFRKVDGTLGYFVGGNGERYSVIGMALDVEPIRMASPLYSGWVNEMEPAGKASENAGSPRLPENPK